MVGDTDFHNFKMDHHQQQYCTIVEKNLKLKLNDHDACQLFFK